MSDETLEQIKADYKKVFTWGIPALLILIFLLVVLSLIPWNRSGCGPDAKTVQSKAALGGMKIAMQAYHHEFYEWPVGADMYSKLRGQNERKICFWDPLKHDSQSDGSLHDPWGHPYVFDGIVDDQPRFHSLGKDGIDQDGAEGSDDIVSWR